MGDRVNSGIHSITDIRTLTANFFLAFLLVLWSREQNTKK